VKSYAELRKDFSVWFWHDAEVCSY